MGLTRTRAALAAGLIAVTMSCGDDGNGVPAFTALRFVDPPTDLVAGQPFDLSVELLGDGEARSSESGRRVSISLMDGGQLSGPITVTTSGGVARFNDLAITTAGTAHRLQGSSGAITTTSAAFTVRVAPVSAARSSFLPDSVVFIPGVPTPIVFTFTDTYGNPVAGQPVSITSSLTGTTLSPSAGVTDASGAFTTAFAATSSGSATLTATIAGAAFPLGGHLAATEFCAPSPLNVPGSVAGAIPIATCDAVGRPAAVYRFTKSGSGGVAFTAVPNGFTARVEVKTALTEQNVAIQPTTGQPTAEWLLPDGPYLYRISGLSLTSSGSYSITASTIAGTSGVTTRFIAAPGTYTGQSLALTDREYGDGTMYDHFVLFSNRSCTITMRSTAFDAVLDIEDAIDLVSVGGNNNSGGGTDARVVVNPCNHNGNPIGILANSTLGPNFSTPTGAYTLTIDYGPPLLALVASPQRAVVVRPDASRRDVAARLRTKGGAVRK